MGDVTLSHQHASDSWSPLRSPALRTGLFTGGLLSFVMAMALIVANRIAFLERLALERNAVSFAAFVVVMLVPIYRFRRSPFQLFVSGMTGWAVFTLAYLLAGFFFGNLFNVLHTPFEVLIYGAAAYGVAAVVIWVCSMLLAARRHPIIHTRRRSSHTPR